MGVGRDVKKTWMCYSMGKGFGATIHSTIRQKEKEKYVKREDRTYIYIYDDFLVHITLACTSCKYICWIPPEALLYEFK